MGLVNIQIPIQWLLGVMSRKRVGCKFIYCRSASERAKTPEGRCLCVRARPDNINFEQTGQLSLTTTKGTVKVMVT
jgi:hypothetical protein